MMTYGSLGKWLPIARTKSVPLDGCVATYGWMTSCLPSTSEKVLKALEALEPPRMLRVTRNMPKSWGLSVTLGCLGHQVCLGYRPNPEHPQEPWMVPENPPAQRENV